MQSKTTFFTIYYRTGCRDCNQTDGIRSLHSVFEENDVNVDVVETWKKRTEFSVKQEIEKWRIRDGNVCGLCNSSEVEVQEISINDEYKLFDLNRIKKNVHNGDAMIFDITKDNGIITYQHGVNNHATMNFINKCYEEMFSMVNKLPGCFSKSHIQGNFYMCFTINAERRHQADNITIQKFQAHGLTKDEIITYLNIGKSENQY